ncbi:ATP-binding protein [Oceanisphaera sp. KMM 10153]|uniref:ATP-binding protein n=1 Tax=Oceanisphaera submarina TaxID=3390193 RepID=UPI003974D2ED
MAFCVNANPVVLTDEERSWIAEHPVVHMAVDPDWKPVEYVENGQHLGLVSEYVAAIERKTGLRFERVPNTGWGAVTGELERGDVDVLPAALKAFTTPGVAQYINFTGSYYVGTTFVVTDNESISIYDLNRLNGKVVALKGGGAYQARIQALYPEVRILATASTEEALQAVVEGRADAALDGSQAIQPLLRRKYRGLLHVSGVIGSLPMELAMGVRRDLPILHSIIDKVLASLTASETDEMIQRWYEETDYGAPTLSVVIQYYGPQLVLAVAGLLLMSGFALHARRERRRAVRSEKEKTMFLAVMSHEIRSPMNAILASMELLQRSELPQEPGRLIHLAASGAENLLRLLDDVLDISKLEAGRLELDIGPVDIMELAQTVADLLSFQAREKGVALVVEEREPIARRVMVDRLRVGQILHNLVSNAVKFTATGTVTISAGYEEATQTLHLRVVDTGVGMDADVRRRLFEPYSQACAATARKFGGTGLGLPICRELVELMQGRMEVESEPGSGTTIAVHLPCKLHATLFSGQRETSSAVIERDVRLSGMSQVINVLLVEDTPANQVVMQTQLDTLGCRSTLP